MTHPWQVIWPLRKLWLVAANIFIGLASTLKWPVAVTQQEAADVEGGVFFC